MIDAFSKTKIPTRWIQNSVLGILICLMAIVFLNVQSATAQTPIQNGWETPATPTQTYYAPLQPVGDTLAPDEFVRNQIGLASFEESVEDGSARPSAQNTPPNPVTDLFSPEQLTSPEGLGSSLKAILLIATLSLAPAIILMTTCYVRVIVVLTLLKQAFGAQQLPPTQVLTALSLFITMLVMTPVWNQIKTDAIDPYTQAENGISWNEAWERGVVPVKTFMAKQIEAAGNDESIALFYEYLPAESTGGLVSQGTAPYQPKPGSPINAQDIPINVLLPAFVISELKVAFLLGFQIYLPFLVLDLVVSSVTVSTGMLMLPPTMVSFPLKLIMFVLVDGWNLVVGMLLQSFATFT